MKSRRSPASRARLISKRSNNMSLSSLQQVGQSMNPQTLTELLARRVAVGGVALIDRDSPITASALEEESRRVAQGLHDLGVREGDRVALWLPNVPAWLACFFACARLGAI